VELGLLVLATVVAGTALPRCGSGRAVVRASWDLTPGVLNPAVTQATIASTICRRGWTRTIRPPVDFTNALKVRQLHQYGLRGPPSAYQEDHLISLELSTLGAPWRRLRSEKVSCLKPTVDAQGSRQLGSRARTDTSNRNTPVAISVADRSSYVHRD
jgi:hypothetical protein